MSATDSYGIDPLPPGVPRHRGRGYGYYVETVTGRGSALSGLGPLTVYPYPPRSRPPPEPKWRSRTRPAGIQGVSKIGPTYRTLFAGSVFRNLDSQKDQRDLLAAGLDFVGTVFVDINRGFWAKSWIESLYRNGVTSGCARNPLTYCPGGLVTRDQMAVFLLRSKEGGTYTPPPCTVKPFNDVEINNTFCPWIQELAARGITHGCGNGNYCPGNPVTRDQMAFFLLTALEGSSYTPPACTETFSDVSPSSTFCPVHPGAGGARHHQRLRWREVLPGEPGQPRPDGEVPGHHLQAADFLE